MKVHNISRTKGNLLAGEKVEVRKFCKGLDCKYKYIPRSIHWLDYSSLLVLSFFRQTWSRRWPFCLHAGKGRSRDKQIANQKKQNSEAAGGSNFARAVHAKDCGVVAVPGKLGLLKSKPGQRENNASKLHRSAGLKIRTSHVKLLEIKSKGPMEEYDDEDMEAHNINATRSMGQWAALWGLKVHERCVRGVGKSKQEKRYEHKAMVWVNQDFDPSKIGMHHGNVAASVKNPLRWATLVLLLFTSWDEWHSGPDESQ